MSSEKLAITVIDFRPLRRNTLRGFCDISVPALRLRIRDVAVHQYASGARSAQLPAKPVIDRDGIAKRGASGKIEYAKMLEFESRVVSDAFSAAVIRALVAFDPHAFDGEAVS